MSKRIAPLLLALLAGTLLVSFDGFASNDFQSDSIEMEAGSMPVSDISEEQGDIFETVISAATVKDGFNENFGEMLVTVLASTGIAVLLIFIGLGTFLLYVRKHPVDELDGEPDDDSRVKNDKDGEDDGHRKIMY